MSSARVDITDAPITDALDRRRAAVREAVASATIEGGDVGPEAKQIMNDWAAGRIDKQTMIQKVLSLDKPT